jgi:FkbM family methyltransferase
MTGALRTWSGVARSLLIYRARPWRQARLARLYAGLLAPGDLAFDIGAHVGNRTEAMRRAGARVVALEPQRAFYRYLRRALPDDVILLPLAAGAAPGRASLSVSRLHPTVSSIAPGFAEQVGGSDSFAHVAWDAREQVEVTTLDALIASFGRPRLIKIDVEGFEAEVLAGLSAPVEVVAFEYLPEALDVALAALDRMAGLGAYRFNAVVGERGAFALPDWLGAEAMHSQLVKLARSGRPGDVYARLAAPGRS